jgi:MFS family permease
MFAIFVLVFCLLMTAFSRGMGESYAVFLLPVSAHFGWERAAASSVYSVYMVSLGVGSPLAGMAFDRFGARFNYLLGAALLAIAYGMAGRLTELWQFYIFLGLFGGIGTAMVAVIPTQSLVSRWFDRRLATALSVAISGIGLGTLMMAPAAQIAIQRLGWPSAYGAAGVGFLGILAGLVLLPWRRIERGAPGNPRRLSPDRATGGSTLSEAIRTRAFWGFFGVYATTATAVFGVSLHVVAYLVGQGFSEVESAFAFGITGLLSIPGMMFTGLAADRWRRPVVSTVSYSLTLIGIGALTAISFFPSGILVAVFVVTFGLSAGARGPIVMTLMAELFSGRGLASIYGAANMGQGFGAAVGTLGAGLLFDRTGSYTLGLALCALFATVGGSLFWLVPEIRGTPARDETAPPVRS